ncbi:iron uptake porin [Spirulina sp. CCNP1310]|uniref:iron uptake porin n=1 Tax=Spirulina sp. CCNP1310 TaxID=3110249 RepID=UPI002B1FAFCB|nr:iron uptake porin [Spirulina sp. CCNP1310]MEA5419615.1 iron uptake porin [Spirulina sp. CCNP1310]
MLKIQFWLMSTVAIAPLLAAQAVQAQSLDSLEGDAATVDAPEKTAQPATLTLTMEKQTKPEPTPQVSKAPIAPAPMAVQKTPKPAWVAVKPVATLPHFQETAQVSTDPSLPLAVAPQPSPDAVAIAQTPAKFTLEPLEDGTTTTPPHRENVEPKEQSEIGTLPPLAMDPAPSPPLPASQHPPQKPLPTPPTSSPSQLPASEPNSPLPPNLAEFNPAAMPAPPPQPWESLDSEPMAQITPVWALRDVEPGNWAYGALADLTGRYDCLAGYPDGSFRGNRPLSRYEFAAGANACLQTMERIITETETNLIPRQDLEILQKIMNEFGSELSQVGQRIDNLDSRVQFLADNQFSTTTKLYGQVVFGLQGRTQGRADITNGIINGDVIGLNRDRIPETPDQASDLTLGYNAQLTLLTQFSPRRFLLTGLQAGNLDTRDVSLFGFNNNFLRLGYELDTDNDLILSDVTYRELITEDLALIVGPVGVSPTNVFRGPSRVESAGFGPISRFAQRNPILQVGAGNSGFGFDWQVSERVSVQGVYAATFGGDSTQGLLGGAYTVGLQTLLTPKPSLDIALHYLHAYSGSLGGFLGTGIGDDQVAVVDGARLSTHAFGATMNWEVTPAVSLGTWFGFTDSQLVSHSGHVQTVNWMIFAQFPDLGGEGNFGGLFFGQPPRITGTNLRSGGVLTGNVPSLFAGTSGETSGGRQDRTLHLEGFYQMRITDRISITPGLAIIFNPNHSRGSDPVAIASLRTTLSF